MLWGAEFFSGMWSKWSKRVLQVSALGLWIWWPHETAALLHRAGSALAKAMG